MDQHHNPREQLHHTSEDKLSRPRLRGRLLHPHGLHAGSLQPDSRLSRFGGMRFGIEGSVVCLLIYFPLLALVRWAFGRRGHSVPDLVGDKANTSRGDFGATKYAATTTIRETLRTATGSRAKRREETMVLGSSSDPGVDHDVEAGASAPSSPRPRPPLPPLSIDEVLQKSVWGFREKWWPTSSTAAFEAARIEEAEGNMGDIGGLDMHPETKAFFDKYVYSHPLCIISSISRTCPAVEDSTCYLPSPSAADAVYPLPSSSITSPPSIRSACPAVNKHTCLVLSPSMANAAGASFSSAAEETTGRARADTTENDVAGSIIAGSGLPPAVVSSPVVVMRPMLVETLFTGEEEPEILSSRVESSLTLIQELTGMEAASLNLPDGVTGGQLETSECGYDGDVDNDDDDNDNDSRPDSLSIGCVMLDSREQQHEEKTEERAEEEQEEEDLKPSSLADGTIGGKLRTIESDDDNDNNDVRCLGSNRFAVLFESSDEEEEEQDNDINSVSLADRAMEEELTTIGSDDVSDGNDAKYAPHVTNNRFAVLFESSEEEEEEEGERQGGKEEWGDTCREESDEEEEEEEVEEEEAKEEMEARQMEVEDDEAQEMQENWREIDDEWEALEEWVEEEEEEEVEGEEELVDN